MGICPRCGSFVDEGEPYCPYCSYIGGSGSNNNNDNVITIDGDDYYKDEVEDALYDAGYDLYDLEHDLIDDEDLEEILDNLDEIR